jgi:hypothetical protein
MHQSNVSFCHVSVAVQPFVGPWPLFSFLILYTVGRTPCTGISPSQGLYLHKQNKHTNIHASSGIRAHDPSVRAGEDCSCLIPRGHCHRQCHFQIGKISVLQFKVSSVYEP